MSDINSLKGAFVFVDEPEISLHPMWQLKVLDYYKSIFTNDCGIQNSQMFFVTHSPFIIHNENRRSDKVIVLYRDEDGNIQIKNNPEYYKCNSISVVKEAFNIDFYNEGQSTVYLEGRTDEKYFNRALEVYDGTVPFSFKWIGYIDNRGQEVNTGSGALTQAYHFLVGRNAHTINICLFDNDTKKENVMKNNVYSRTLPFYNNSKNISKGIENALILDDFDIQSFYSQTIKTNDYGGINTINELRKMDLCNYICSLEDEVLVKVFANLLREIDSLNGLFNGND